MTLSEARTNTSLVKDFCGISGGDSDALLEVYSDAAVSFMLSYTGLDEAGADEHPDLVYAFLALVCEMFNNRTMTVDENTLNPTAEQIMERWQNCAVAKGFRKPPERIQIYDTEGM